LIIKKMVNQEAITAKMFEQLRKGAHYWFIQYNPLYFFSAFFILFGMSLVSKGLTTTDWEQGQLLLTAIIQIYEILLIASGALLFRGAGEYRPSVILGLLAVFFLFDCTFRTEVIASLGHIGVVLTVAWIVITALKLMALVWAFQLKAPLTVFTVPILAAMGIAGMPLMFSLANIDIGTLHLMVTWYAVALTAFVLWKSPKVACAVKLDKWGETVLRRAIRAAWTILAGFFLYHIAFLSKQETWRELLVWVGGFGSLAIALTEPASVAPTALIVGIVFAWQARDSRQYRLFVGMVVSLYIALWTIGWQNWPFPEMNLWLNISTAIILLVMAWRLRLVTALLPLLVGLYELVKVLTSLGVLGWGILFLGTGFVALIVGVAVNWNMREAKRSVSVASGT
jgi:hypothetical protein